MVFMNGQPPPDGKFYELFPKTAAGIGYIFPPVILSSIGIIAGGATADRISDACNVSTYETTSQTL